MRTTETKLIEIIKTKTEWDLLVDSAIQSDFYHTYDYHQISKDDEEDAILIKYTQKGNIILLPLLLRTINHTKFKDATSVYGYAGPLSIEMDENFDSSLFQIEFQKFLNENNIITVFSRLNPFIAHQDKILKGIGIIDKIGKIVTVDIKQDLETQFYNYQKRLRNYVNKSRKLCSIRKGSSKKDILSFIDMYYQNMERVHAKEQYFFPKNYFFDLMKSEVFETEILLTTYLETNETIAGAMFIKKDGIVHYHLSGSREEFLFLNPLKLMIDEMRILATLEGRTFYNLGGGIGSKEDSLFRFKANFSKEHKTFKVWKYIANDKVYKELSMCSHCPKLNVSCDNFFPSYRCCI